MIESLRDIIFFKDNQSLKSLFPKEISFYYLDFIENKPEIKDQSFSEDHLVLSENKSDLSVYELNSEIFPSLQYIMQTRYIYQRYETIAHHLAILSFVK